MIKALLFDLDGTILNTSIDLTNSFNYAFSTMGFEKRSVEEIKPILGYGVSVSLKRLLSEIDEEQKIKILTLFKNFYSEHYLDNTVPYDGVRETLLQLKKKYRLAIVTNKNEEMAISLINHLLGNIFEVIVGSIPERNRKPDPEMINYALTKLNISNDECIYIGDTDADALTAYNAKVKMILVSYGYKEKEFLKQNYPNEIIIDKINDIFEYLR